MSEIIHEINTLRRARKALILAHYYQIPEIQELADFVGDSLELARKAAETDAETIVFAGVKFMAETAKILNPDKKVLLPDFDAGCSLADSCSEEDMLRFRKKYPDHKLVSYINCSAKIKAISDLVCTSSNAERIINSFSRNEKIIFAPDRNLGAYLKRKTKRDLVLWNGSCVVHEAFSMEKLLALKIAHPKAKLIAHPEADSVLLDYADFIGSTSQLLRYVADHPHETILVATEAGVLTKMMQAAPNACLIPVPVKEDNSCACSECAFMKVNTLEKIRDCLKYDMPEIVLEKELMDKARIPLIEMFKLS